MSQIIMCKWGDHHWMMILFNLILGDYYQRYSYIIDLPDLSCSWIFVYIISQLGYVRMLVWVLKEWEHYMSLKKGCYSVRIKRLKIKTAGFKFCHNRHYKVTYPT